MNEQRTEVAIDADRNSWKRIGAIPGCLALGCSDVGEATVAGERVYITWGRNVSAEQQEWFSENTSFRPIRLGAHDGSAELILTDDVVRVLLPLLRYLG